MDPITEVVSSGTVPLLEYAVRTGRTIPETLKRAGKGTIRQVIAITPPATSAGVSGGLDSSSDAKARGARAIQRDLNRVFVPVRLKGKRREAVSGAEMVTIHARLLAQKRPGAPMKRDRGQPYYVDQRKFNLLEVKLASHVGRLAAGWLPAAEALALAVPQWISRHGLGRGGYEAKFEGDEMFIKSTNNASPFAPIAETQRRVDYALVYQANAMRREMEFLLLKDARSSGLRVA